MLLCGLVVAPLQAAPGERENRGEQLRGLSSESEAKIETSIPGFLANKKINPDRSANDLGWDCLAAGALVEAGNAGAADKLTVVAEQMLQQAVRSRKGDKPIGWSSSIAGRPACVRAERGGDGNGRGQGRDDDRGGIGSCDGTDITYAFQTGLGIACLSRASTLLNRPDFLEAAQSAFAYWDRQRLKAPPCKDCIFYATSDSAADSRLYVRNMNVFMAFGAASLAQATKDERYADAARKAMRSDVWERGQGNRGYLSKLDPLWSSRANEAERIENHSASVALLSVKIGRMLHSDELVAHGLTVWRDWATCDNDRCRKAGCKYWAGDAQQCQATGTAAHCAFRQDDPLAAAQCNQYLSRVPRVPGYGIWAASLEK